MGLQDKLNTNKSVIETAKENKDTETSNNNASANAAIQAEKLEAAKEGKVQTETGTVETKAETPESTKANEETKEEVIKAIEESNANLNTSLADAGVDISITQKVLGNALASGNIATGPTTTATSEVLSDEGTIGDALSRLAGLELLPPYDPPKGAYKSLRIHQLILPDGTVEKPNDYGYYVDSSEEAKKMLNYFNQQGKVEKVK